MWAPGYDSHLRALVPYTAISNGLGLVGTNLSIYNLGHMFSYLDSSNNDERLQADRQEKLSRDNSSQHLGLGQRVPAERVLRLD